MLGTATAAGDAYVTFTVPDDDKVLDGDGDNAVARLVVYDNKAHRASAIDAKTVLSLKATKKPLSLPLIGGHRGPGGRHHPARPGPPARRRRREEARRRTASADAAARLRGAPGRLRSSPRRLRAPPPGYGGPPPPAGGVRRRSTAPIRQSRWQPAGRRRGRSASAGALRDARAAASRHDSIIVAGLRCGATAHRQDPVPVVRDDHDGDARADRRSASRAGTRSPAS